MLTPHAKFFGTGALAFLLRVIAVLALLEERTLGLACSFNLALDVGLIA